MPVTTATIAQLAPQVASRLQDDTFIFWQQRYEVFSALGEALSDLLLLIGRPTIVFNTQITLLPNTVWQPMPANMIAITNIRTDQYSLWKTDVHTMDYLQGSWSSDWESDVAESPLRYGPLGWTTFFVHPAPTTPQLVNIAGVQNPITTPWPPTGAESSCFTSEFDVALQLYATAYLRVKELGDDSAEGNELMGQYLDIAARLTNIEDRRDVLLFSRALGTPTAPSLVSAR